MARRRSAAPVRPSPHPTPGATSRPLLAAGAALALVLGLKIALALTLASHPLLQPVGDLDAGAYWRLAQRVAGGDVLLQGTPFVVSPLYIYWLAFAQVVTGASVTGVLVLQAMLGTCAVWLTARTASLWVADDARTSASMVAGGALALCGIVALQEAQILQSALDALLMSSFAYACTRALQQGTARWWTLSGVALALLATNRPNAWLLALPVLGGALLVRAPSRRGEGRVPLRAGLALVVGVVLVLAPFTLRARLATGEWQVLPGHGGLNFYIGNHAQATGTYTVVEGVRPSIEGQMTDVQTVASRAAGRSVTPAEASAFFVRRGLAWWGEAPADAMRVWLYKLWLTTHAWELPVNASYAWFREQVWLLWLMPVGAWLLVPVGIAASLGINAERRAQNAERWDSEHAARSTQHAERSGGGNGERRTPNAEGAGAGNAERRTQNAERKANAERRTPNAEGAGAGNEERSTPNAERWAPAVGEEARAGWRVFRWLMPVYLVSVALFFVVDRYRAPALVLGAIHLGVLASLWLQVPDRRVSALMRSITSSRRALVAVVVAVVVVGAGCIPLPFQLGEAEADTQMALHAIGQGRDDEADRWLARAVARHRAPGITWFRVGLAWQSRDDLPRAERALREAHRLDGDEPEVAFALAGVLLSQGKGAEALPLLQQVDRAGQRQDRVRLDLALAQWQAGDEAGARATLARGVPQEGLPLLRARALAAVDARRDDVARWLLEEHRRYVRDDAEVAEKLALMQARAGEVTAATTLLEEAMRLDARRATARFNLAVIRARQGRRDEAIALLQEALRIDPTYAQAAGALQELSRVR